MKNPLAFWLKPKTKERPLRDVISSLFHYSFDEINWEYKNLTKLEKKAVSEKEFELLKLKFRKDGSDNN